MKIKSFLLYIVLAVVATIVSYVCGVNVAKADPIKVAVIDTGFNKAAYGDQVKLCKESHASFTETSALIDEHGHGSHIAGIIANLGEVDYCLLILKIYSTNHTPNSNLKNSIDAINYAVANDVDMINYSGGGLKPSNEEREAVTKALDKGIVFVAAAGNEGYDLSKISYYPAMYDSRIIIVGNGYSTKKRSPNSNFGSPIDVWVPGNKIKSLNGIMSGSSQSTAIITRRFLLGFKNKR